MSSPASPSFRDSKSSCSNNLNSFAAAISVETNDAARNAPFLVASWIKCRRSSRETSGSESAMVREPFEANKLSTSSRSFAQSSSAAELLVVILPPLPSGYWKHTLNKVGRPATV